MEIKDSEWSTGTNMQDENTLDNHIEALSSHDHQTRLNAVAALGA
jgi:hypothetical protein